MPVKTQNTRLSTLALSLAAAAGCAQTVQVETRAATSAAAEKPVPAHSAQETNHTSPVQQATSPVQQATTPPVQQATTPPAQTAPEVQAILVCDTRHVDFGRNEKPAVSWNKATGPVMDLPVRLEPAYEDAQWSTVTYARPLHTADKNCTLKSVFKNTADPAPITGYCADEKGGLMRFDATADGATFNPVKRALSFRDAQTGEDTLRLLNPKDTCYFLKPAHIK